MDGWRAGSSSTRKRDTVCGWCPPCKNGNKSSIWWISNNCVTTWPRIRNNSPSKCLGGWWRPRWSAIDSGEMWRVSVGGRKKIKELTMVSIIIYRLFDFADWTYFNHFPLVRFLQFAITFAALLVVVFVDKEVAVKEEE